MRCSIDYNYPTKNCETCQVLIILKTERDITRKRFCSRKCLGIFNGKNRNPELLQKMINAANTPEANAKKVHRGKEHPRYINDRTLIKSKRPQYENTLWRKQVFERDDYTCQNCKTKGGKLQADHIKPYFLYPDLRWDINNGRTLCVDCHKKTDTYGLKLWWKLKKGELEWH